MSKDMRGKVSIVGSGLIGRSFAMLFASAGYEVYMYDVLQSQISLALNDIGQQLMKLKEYGRLRGTLTAEQQLSCIKGCDTLEECLVKSLHVQECVPENLDLKVKVFKQLDLIAEPDTVLSSSTSCILPSKFTEDLKHKANCIVCHPVNPPFYVPAVEVVPAPWTSTQVMQKSCALMEEIGLVPIKFAKEIQGFAVNRIQYAIMNECWHLVKGGYLTADDVDKVMTEGLALRYAWCGPFENIHLNAEGTANYVERYGETIHSVSQTFLPPPTWTVKEAKEISQEMEATFPLDQLQKRRAWRDERLVALSALKKTMKKKEEEESTKS